MAQRPPRETDDPPADEFANVQPQNESGIVGAWYLSFPLSGYSWKSKLVNTVFDHSVPSGYYYGHRDYKIIAWTGEQGSGQSPNCGQSDCDSVNRTCAYKKYDGLSSCIGGNFDISGTYYWAYPEWLNYDGHPGFDYHAGCNTPIYAPAEGDLFVPGSDWVNGDPSTFNTFAIDHGNGYSTWILHSASHISAGHVLRGQQIGTVGTTGTGACHLHFEVRKNVNGTNYPVDPYGWAGGGIDPYTSVPNTNLWMNSGVNWTFTLDGDLNGWTPYNVENYSVNYGQQGNLVIDPAANDPYILSPPLVNVPTSQYNTVEFKMATINPSTKGKIYFITSSYTNWDESKSVGFTIQNDGTYRIYRVQMNANQWWSGNVTGIRIDPGETGVPNQSWDSVGFNYIKLTSGGGQLYTLTISKTGNGSGTVTSDDSYINCGATCSHDYSPGTVVKLTPSPAQGSKFDGWYGCDTVQFNVCTVTMNSLKTVQATFDLQQTTYKLTVQKDGTGSGSVTSGDGHISCGATCSYDYNSGTYVTLTASASQGSTFDHWSGCDSSQGSTCYVTMNSARSVTATFNVNPTKYKLTAAKAGDGSGTVASSDGYINCGSTCSYDYDKGTQVTLTATESQGSTFASWSGCDTTQGNQCIVTMNNARTVTATFNLVQTKYTLHTYKIGSGSGTITSSDSHINCGATCTYDYQKGTVVTLTATADSGSTFIEWSGCDSTNGNTCTFTMNAERWVSATINLKTYTLSVQKNGTGTGTVTSNDGHINCGSVCSYDYSPASQVTLTASASQGSQFAGWNGCDSINGNTCTVSMYNARTATATFNQSASKYKLTVSKLGTGTGTLGSTDGHINCGPTCSYDYDQGTQVTLIATPSSDSVFSGWIGCDTFNGNSCTVTMNNVRSVSATFVYTSYRLTVSRNGTGSGTVASNDWYINCGATCYRDYNPGTQVYLYAYPDNGSQFVDWVGCDSKNGNTCLVTMNSARQVTATFNQIQSKYRLQVSRRGTGAGTATSNDGHINCGGQCSFTYDNGAQVLITANAGQGSSFSAWSGCDTTNGNTCTVTMNRPHTVLVYFTGAQYTVSVVKSGSGGGTVQSEDRLINCGQVCSYNYPYNFRVMLKANADAGSVFTGWQGCDASHGTVCLVAATRMATVTAGFDTRGANFSERFDNAPNFGNKWQTYWNDSGTNWTYTPGKFRIQADKDPCTTHTFGLRSNPTFTGNIDVSVELNHAGKGRTSIGLLSPDRESDQTWIFLDTDDTNYLNFTSGQNSTDWKYAGDPYMNRWITERIQVVGSQVNFYVDGQLLQTWPVPDGFAQDRHFIVFGAGSACWKSGSNDTSFRKVTAAGKVGQNQQTLKQRGPSWRPY